MMRASLAIALVLPVVLTGCPALLSDWTISGSGAIDASVDAAGPEAAGGSSGSGSGGDGGSAGSRGGSPSGGSGGRSSGGSSGADAGADAASATVYNDVTNPSFWSVFDTTSLTADAQGFFGGAFDGRYVYLVPQGETPAQSHPLAVRYDTHADFLAPGSWQTFDTGSINTASVGYRGGAFDGRYVYLVPFYNSTASTVTGAVARFDTQATFTDGASWATFDTTLVDVNAEGFDGAVFDGRYVYLVPHVNGTVARYDTQAGFDTVSSWATFDATTLAAGAQGFLGSIFDGRFVYLIPNGSGGLLTRYDTRGTFTSGAAWATFDTTMANPSAQSFLGGAFDGRHVYLAPFPAGNTVSTLALRYDPTGGLVASSFDSFNVSRSFAGGAFDGRFVYFAPSASSVLERYDSAARAFSASSSWGSFDLSSVSVTAETYYGAVFDGRFMYFVPGANGTVARFDAKVPTSMPSLPGWNGSFL